MHQAGGGQPGGWRFQTDPGCPGALEGSMRSMLKIVTAGTL